MEEKQVWRSIRFPEELAQKIEKIAKQEKRSFSSQALVFIESELESQKEAVQTS